MKRVTHGDCEIAERQVSRNDPIDLVLDRFARLKNTIRFNQPDLKALGWVHATRKQLFLGYKYKAAQFTRVAIWKLVNCAAFLKKSSFSRRGMNTPLVL